MRIVSLLPSTTEIVCALGLEDSLVGITHECDYPASVAGKPRLTASRISQETMSSNEIDHAVRSQLDGHGSIYDLDEVRLRELNPDLILTQELCDVCAVSYQTVEQAARRFEADVRVVSLEPNTIGDIFENIRLVGEITGRKREAGKLVDDLNARLDSRKGINRADRSSSPDPDARMAGTCLRSRSLGPRTSRDCRWRPGIWPGRSSQHYHHRGRDSRVCTGSDRVDTVRLLQRRHPAAIALRESAHRLGSFARGSKR